MALILGIRKESGMYHLSSHLQQFGEEQLASTEVEGNNKKQNPGTKKSTEERTIKSQKSILCKDPF